MEEARLPPFVVVGKEICMNFPSNETNHWFTRKFIRYMQLLSYTIQHNKLQFLLYETADLFNALCRQYLISICKEPSSSLYTNIVSLAASKFDSHAVRSLFLIWNMQYNTELLQQLSMSDLLSLISYSASAFHAILDNEQLGNSLAELIAVISKLRR